ncbi:MAG: RNA polymerase sigma factor [Alphaproteobacteria bacterium]|nr:RNA polymerase sigma factor [Alphaproteobacteria bacterium]
MDDSLETIRNQMVALLPRLRRFALSLAGNTADADDLVQDAVERALRNLHQWERGTRLDSWMFRIAQNLFIDEARSRRRNRQVVVEGSENLPEPARDGARDAESRVTWTQTTQAMMTLPAEQRSAVALVLVEGMSYRDAADILGVPIGTLTSRLARGREALAEKIFGSAQEVSL